MTRSPIWMARSLAVLLLAGSVTAASAQTDQEHDAHHPDGSPAAESGPAPQASPDEEQPDTGGMGQHGQGMMGSTQMDHDLSESAQAYMDAMQTMMDGMASMEMTGDPARDFALMMIPHHQSAIDMAEAFLQHSSDPELTKLANEIVSAQQEEIEFLRNWLGETR